MWWLIKRHREDKRRLKARTRDLYGHSLTAKLCLLLVLAAALAFAAMVGAEAETDIGNPIVGTVTARKLCGRSEPSEKASVEWMFDRGDELTITAMDGGWAVCEMGAETCYCWAEYLDVGGAGEYTVDGGALNVRKLPDSKKAVRKLKSGTAVTVESVILGHDGNLWGRIDGGYVRMDYLVPQE